MSDSIIPPAPPLHVKLNDRGIEYWNKWNILGTGPVDVFAVVDTRLYQDDVELYRLCTTNGNELWMDQPFCIAVTLNDLGMWEEIQ